MKSSASEPGTVPNTPRTSLGHSSHSTPPTITTAPEVATNTTIPQQTLQELTTSLTNSIQQPRTPATEVSIPQLRATWNQVLGLNASEGLPSHSSPSPPPSTPAKPPRVFRNFQGEIISAADKLVEAREALIDDLVRSNHVSQSNQKEQTIVKLMDVSQS